MAKHIAKLLRKQTRLKKKYFLEEEYYETLSPIRVHSLSDLALAYRNDEKSPILDTHDYKYECSGAIYSG